MAARFAVLVALSVQLLGLALAQDQLEPIRWVVTDYDPLEASVGSTVTFEYQPFHTVASVPTQEDFDACNLDAAEIICDLQESPCDVEVTEGTQFIICDVGTHCVGGQKIAITGSVEAATDAPTADGEATDAPTVDGEATEAPSTDVEATEAPSTDVEATEAPTVDGEATEAPSTDVEATDAPTVDGEATDAPTTEGEATAAPTTEGDSEAPTTAEDGNATEAPAASLVPTTSGDGNVTQAPVTAGNTTAPTTVIGTSAPTVSTEAPSAAPTVFGNIGAEIFASQCNNQTEQFATEAEAMAASEACGCDGVHQDPLNGAYMFGYLPGQCTSGNLATIPSGELRMAVIDSQTATIQGRLSGLQQNCQGFFTINDGYNCGAILGVNSMGSSIYEANYTTDDAGEAMIAVNLTLEEVLGSEYPDIRYLVGRVMTVFGCAVPVPPTQAPTFMPTLSPTMNVTATPTAAPTENATTAPSSVSTGVPTSSSNDTTTAPTSNSTTEAPVATQVPTTVENTTAPTTTGVNETAPTASADDEDVEEARRVLQETNETTSAPTAGESNTTTSAPTAGESNTTTSAPTANTTTSAPTPNTTTSAPTTAAIVLEFVPQVGCGRLLPDADQTQTFTDVTPDPSTVPQLPSAVLLEVNGSMISGMSTFDFGDVTADSIRQQFMTSLMLTLPPTSAPSMVPTPGTATVAPSMSGNGTTSAPSMSGNGTTEAPTTGESTVVPTTAGNGTTDAPTTDGTDAPTSSSDTNATTDAPTASEDTDDAEGRRLRRRALQMMKSGFVSIRTGSCEELGDFFQLPGEENSSFWETAMPFELSEETQEFEGTINLATFEQAVTNETEYIGLPVVAENADGVFACGEVVAPIQYSGFVYAFVSDEVEDERRLADGNETQEFTIIGQIDGFPEGATLLINNETVDFETTASGSVLIQPQPIEGTFAQIQETPLQVVGADGEILTNTSIGEGVTPPTPSAPTTTGPTPQPGVQTDDSLALGLGLGLGLGIPLLAAVAFFTGKSMGDGSSKQQEGERTGNDANAANDTTQGQAQQGSSFNDGVQAS